MNISSISKHLNELLKGNTRQYIIVISLLLIIDMAIILYIR